MVREIGDAGEKRRIARAILEALPDWFAIDEARERYIRESGGQLFLAAVMEDEPVGFLCLKETGAATVELAVMGVLQEHHRQGLGRELVEAARRAAKARGYSFLQVKTVAMGLYPDYDATNLFYRSLGFQEFEVIPELWGKENPCQIYVMGLDK